MTYSLKAEAKAAEIGKPDPEEVNRFHINVADNLGRVLASARYDDINGYRPSWSAEIMHGTKLNLLSPLHFDPSEIWSVHVNDELVREFN